MVFLRNFKYKLAISVVIAVISTLYQIESKDEILISEKSVVMTKSRKEVFEYLTKLSEYPAWFPNIVDVESMDSSKQVTIGKRYKVTHTYLFGIGSTTSQLTVISNQAPAIFEFLLDNVLMERNKLELDNVDGDRTRLKWKVLTRRKSSLFRYTIGLLYQFYYSNLLREAFFTLQSLMRK